MEMDTMATTTTATTIMITPKHQTSAGKLSRSRECKSSDYFIQSQKKQEGAFHLKLSTLDIHALQDNTCHQ
eukprot:4972311-Ditylum_brightwellii.AAC.1